MHLLRRTLALSFGIALLVQPALAQQPGTFEPNSSAPMSGMSGMADSQVHSQRESNVADQAMIAGMERMNQAMSAAPMTGDPDRDFIAMMMPHHQGAIDMARVELQYGKDPELRRLAKGITAQEKEIEEMRHWQAQHHIP
jgi:uncharacterized protein (DUF305 family)